MPLLGAGTELGDGFVVPEGAELMTWPTGDGFSSDAEPVWGASMWVTGDPIELFNDLAAQATELGFDVVEQDSGDCRILEQTPPYPWISCFTDGYRVSDGVRSERVSMSVSVRGEAVPVAQVGVDTVATERVGEFGDGPWQLRRFEPVTARADAPDVDLVPSDVGVGDRLVDVDWHRTTLVEGSRLVVSGAESKCTAGMKAVVHVDGDPDEVFDAYADQLTARGGAYGEPAEETTRARRARTPHPNSDRRRGQLVRHSDDGRRPRGRTDPHPDPGEVQRLNACASSGGLGQWSSAG